MFAAAVKKSLECEMIKSIRRWTTCARLKTHAFGHCEMLFIRNLPIAPIFQATFRRNWHFVRFPHSLWVRHHCRKNPRSVTLCQSRTTNKARGVITVLCVENLHLEVNMDATLWSSPLTGVTQSRNKRWGGGVAETETPLALLQDAVTWKMFFRLMF